MPAVTTDPDETLRAAPADGFWRPAGTERKAALLQVSAATAVLLGLPTVAQAFPAAYRLAFLTADAFTATSTSIGTYNTDVANEAALSSSTNLPGVTWTALASVSGTSAVTNVSCGSSCDALPIYLVDGTLIGTIANFLAGTNTNTITEDQYGNSNFNYVWTGSNSDGTAAAGNELGSSDPIYGNAPNVASQMNAYSDPFNTDDYPLYAISSEIQTPEPAMGSALLLGGLMVTRVFRRRRR